MTFLTLTFAQRPMAIGIGIGEALGALALLLVAVAALLVAVGALVLFFKLARLIDRLEGRLRGDHETDDKDAGESGSKG